MNQGRRLEEERKKKMKIEQYVMAYGVEHDRLRAILPDGFISPRPVLRINAEIREEKEGYAEFNIAVEKDGKTGWLNISCWNDIKFKKSGRITVFENENLNIAFTGVGIEGSCPAEKGSAGCYFIKGGEIELVPPETITGKKEFCDCNFEWRLENGGARGASAGKTFPAVPAEVKNVYPKQEFSLKNAAVIPCEKVLGSYKVEFMR